MTAKSKKLERAAGKRKLFEELMKEDHVLVHLDGRRAEVKIPDSLRGNSALVLKLSYRFQGATTVDEQGITSYLKFGGDYEKCVLPWDTIWGMTGSNGKNVVWPEDMPKELLVQIAKAQLVELGKKLLGRGTPKKEDTAAKPPAAVKEKKKGFHLRRVK